MGIRTFRNKIIRHNLGVAGLREFRVANNPRRRNAALKVLAKRLAERSEANRMSAEAHRKASENRVANRPGLVNRAVRSMGRIFSKAFGRKG